MRLWILVVGGVLVLGAAIWPLRSPRPPATPQVAPAVAAQPKPVEAARPEPPKVVEVIDLARAYEPVREPEDPAGAVNPASLIQIPDGPRQIPPAIDLADAPSVERIDIIPRETGSGRSAVDSIAE